MSKGTKPYHTATKKAKISKEPLYKFRCWKWGTKQKDGITVEAPSHMAARYQASHKLLLNCPANEILALEIRNNGGLKR